MYLAVYRRDFLDVVTVVVLSMVFLLFFRNSKRRTYLKSGRRISSCSLRRARAAAKQQNSLRARVHKKVPGKIPGT
jgi:hypothetical protein